MSEHEKIKIRPFPKIQLTNVPTDVQEWLKAELDLEKQVEVQPVPEYTLANAKLTFQGEGKPAIVTFEDGSTMEVDVKFEVG